MGTHPGDVSNDDLALAIQDVDARMRAGFDAVDKRFEPLERLADAAEAGIAIMQDIRATARKWTFKVAVGIPATIGTGFFLFIGELIARRLI